jgi:serine/threonine-protein phosphatase 2A regulatory subunit B
MNATLCITDKTIKLWKVFEKSLRVVAENNLSASSLSSGSLNTSDFHPSPLNNNSAPFPNNNSQSPQLRLPRMAFHDNIVAAVPRKVYANAHAYHINSISINSDGETYMSADDLRINLWNLNISDQSFSKLTLTLSCR